MTTKPGIQEILRRLWHGFVALLIFAVAAPLAWLAAAGVVRVMSVVDELNGLVLFIALVVGLALIWSLVILPFQIATEHYEDRAFAGVGQEGMDLIREARLDWGADSNAEGAVISVISAKVTASDDKGERDAEGHMLARIQKLKLELNLSNSLQQPLVYAEALCTLYLDKLGLHVGDQAVLQYLKSILRSESSAVIRSVNLGLTLEIPDDQTLSYRVREGFEPKPDAISCKSAGTHHKPRVLTPHSDVELTLDRSADAIRLKNRSDDQIRSLTIRCIMDPSGLLDAGVRRQTLSAGQGGQTLPPGVERRYQSSDLDAAVDEKDAISFRKARECVVAGYEST